MTSFDSFGLSAPILQGIRELGFTEPTPVQAKVIPMLLKANRDLVALAQTGTGKTAAYGVPLLQLTDPADAAVQAVVLCPTRELCLQIAKDLEELGRFATHLRVLPVYGGAPIHTQIRALHRGVHIVVATPGRMNDLMRRGAIDLGGVRRVVLDEADEMLNMGFEEDLETILAKVPDSARTLLFSATMPKQVAAMAGKYLHDPEEILIGQRNAGATNVTHECYTVHARDRYAAMRRLIDCRPGFYGIVFCRTRAETQDIARRLAADGYNADTLHGDLSQDQRDRVMNSFRVRAVQILVATDVAARGLDVDDLTHVIHYELPADPDVYTHRSGRTGRAGKAGVSMVLAHMREDYKLRAIERILSKRFEHKPVPGGREVIEARLQAFAESFATKDTTVDLADYLPGLVRQFEGLTREQIIEQAVLREMKRVITDYTRAPDLNVQVRHRHDEPGSPRPAAPSRGPVGKPIEGAGVFIRVNIGLRNGLNPGDLISLINRATPGPMLRVGRIRILDQDSVFEVAPDAVDIVLPGLNRGQYRGRNVRAVVEHDRTHGMPSRNRRPAKPWHRERQ